MKLISHDRQDVRETPRQRAVSGARASRPHAINSTASEPADLRLLQLLFLAAAVFVVSAGYGALIYEARSVA